MPFSLSGRSSTPSSTSDTNKSLKRRSFLPQLSRAGLQDESELSSRSANGQTSRQEEHDETPNRETINRAASLTASKGRRPLSTIVIPSQARPDTRGSDRSSQAITADSSLITDSTDQGTIRRAAGLRTTAVSTVQRTASVRNAAAHGRSGSVVSIASVRPPGSKSLRSLSPTKPTDRSAGKADPLQQQLSPNKNSAVRTLASPTKDGVQLEMASSEHSREQVELLQLSLLHERACKDLRSYEQASHAMLRESHRDLRVLLGEVIVKELAHEKQVNLIAMSLWQSEQAYLMDRLRALQKLHEEISALLQEGSSYRNAISTFVAWSEAARAVVLGEQIGFVDALPDAWRHAHAAVTFRVRSLQHDLALLPLASEPSSVFSLMSSCRELLDGLSMELNSALQLEQELLDQDRFRIDEAVKCLPQVTLNPINVWVPRWQIVSS